MPRPLLNLLLLLCLRAFAGDDFALLCADRGAVERVYYNYRLGDKPAFEVAVPPGTIEALVRSDRRKAAVLRRVYQVEITPILIEAEVKRIEATTRAPEVLAELKSALDHDPARFARTVARPLVVERELRVRFENDDRLHAAQRQAASQARAEQLAARGEPLGQQIALLRRSHAGEFSLATWLFTPVPPHFRPPPILALLTSKSVSVRTPRSSPRQ